MSDQALIARQPVAVISVETEAGPVLSVATRQVGAFIAAAGQGAAGRDGAFGGVLKAVNIAIASRGQKIIPLTQPPTQLSSVALEVNGGIYRSPNISADETKIVWNNQGFQLDPSDTVVLTYF